MKTYIFLILNLLASCAFSQPLVVRDTDTSPPENFIAAITGFPDVRQHTGVMGLSYEGTGVNGSSDTGVGVKASSNSGTALVVRGAVRKDYTPGNLLRIYDPDTGALLGEFEFEIVVNNP